jgi:hypothetical protein
LPRESLAQHWALPSRLALHPRAVSAVSRLVWLEQPMRPLRAVPRTQDPQEMHGPLKAISPWLFQGIGTVLGRWTPWGRLPAEGQDQEGRTGKRM